MSLRSMSLRSIARNALPLPLRQELRHLQRQIQDKSRGLSFSDHSGFIKGDTQIQLTQPIIRTNFFENKLKNIARGCELVSQSALAPQSHWSFWHRVGRASSSNGFHMGRNLVDGVLSAQVGGGLCQISCMIYHLALLAGLQIIERHPHSIDIYQEHLRFTPLGADATVVWGTKDLRLFNPHEFSAMLVLSVQGKTLVGEIHSEQPLQAKQVEFKRSPITPNSSQVVTCIDGIAAATNLYQHKPA